MVQTMSSDRHGNTQPAGMHANPHLLSFGALSGLRVSPLLRQQQKQFRRKQVTPFVA